MTSFGQFWPSSWTVDSVLNGAAVSAGSTSSLSGAIGNSAASPNEILDTEVDVEIAYGSSVTGGGVTVYICRQTQGGYESPASDAPFAFTMPVVASTTCKRTVTISGQDVGGFKVAVANPSGNATVTATLYYRQSQGQIG